MKKQSKYKYLFPLSIQMELPDDFWNNKEFLQHLKLLQEFGFYGVELNITDPTKLNIEDIQNFLQNFNLKMTMVASGLAAKIFNLSLSAHEDSVRKGSIYKCKELIDFVEKTDVGIIIGFLKGTISKDPIEAKRLFKRSLVDISTYAMEKKVRILIEATNKKETSIITTLAEAVDTVKTFNNRYLEILPDTYHMNIEEQESFQVLKKYKSYYKSLHISDNNRFFPGLGTIRFDAVFKLLQKIGYQEGIAIEGNIKDDFAKDLQNSMEYLIPLITFSSG